MRFTLDTERREFAASLHALLADADVPAVAAAWAAGDPAPGRGLWKRLAELGVTALAVPERAGGLGAHPVDLVVALEELGHHAVPGPVIESLAAVPTLLAALPDRDADGSAEWLPALAGGELVATLVVPPHVPFALDADAADLALSVAPRTGAAGAPTAAAGAGDGAPVDVSTVGVLDGLASGPEASVDPARRLFRPGAVRPLAACPGGEAERAFDVGVLGCAAQLLGLARALRDAAVEHARRREQFGQPIGSFQAVAHQLADVHVAIELARPLVYAAALSLAAPPDVSPPTLTARDVSAAKVAAGQAAHRAARTALQVHGALGYTAEHDMGRFLLKTRALVGAWGTPAVHRARVRAALPGDRSGAPA
jgi:alkylation response protein AidB-like acyl-CoA dehydrogenase